MQQYFRKPYFPVAWLIILHILLLFPVQSLTEEKLVFIPHFDKLVHFGIYFLLTAGWTYFILHHPKLNEPRQRGWMLILLLLALADGLAIEFLQKTPLIHRDFDLLDAVFDGLGAATGIYLTSFLHNRKLKSGNTIS